MPQRRHCEHRLDLDVINILYIISLNKQLTRPITHEGGPLSFQVDHNTLEELPTFASHIKSSGASSRNPSTCFHCVVKSGGLILEKSKVCAALCR